MKISKCRILSVLTAMCVLVGSTCVFGADDTLSKSVRLSTHEGTVSVYKGKKALSKITDGMRLFDGYTLKTAAESFAFLELDDQKFVKTDQNSSIKIQKKGKSNTLLVESGALFFNVTKPLEKDESLQVRTTNITMGVRGTTGLVSSKPTYNPDGTLLRTVVDTQIYTGRGYLNITNDLTGDNKSIDILPGNNVKITVSPNASDVKIEQSPILADASNIPAVAQGELIKLPDVLETISKTTQLDTDKIQSSYQQKQIAENEAAKQEVSRTKETIKIPQTSIPYIGDAPEASTEIKPVPDKPKTENKEQNSSSSSGGSSKPNKPSEPDKPTEPDEPTDPDKPSEPDEPTDPDEPVDPDEPISPDDPDEPDEPDEPTDPDTSKSVAVIDGNYYKTLEEALDAATSGQNVILQKSVACENHITINEGVTLTISHGNTLNAKDGITVMHELVIENGASLKSEPGKTITFGENAYAITSNGSKAMFVLSNVKDATTDDMKGKTFSYLFNNGSEIWILAEANDNEEFVNIESNEFKYISSSNNNNPLASGQTWRNSGVLVIHANLIGPDDNSNTYVYCTSSSMLVLGPNSNFYSADGQLTGTIKNKKLFIWQYGVWEETSGVVTELDNAYANLDTALDNAQNGDVFYLMGMSTDSPEIFYTNRSIFENVTLIIDDHNTAFNINQSTTNSGEIIVKTGRHLENKDSLSIEATLINNGTITIEQNGCLNIKDNGSITNKDIINIYGAVSGLSKISGENGATIEFGRNAEIIDELTDFYDVDNAPITSAEQLLGHTFTWNDGWYQNAD